MKNGTWRCISVRPIQSLPPGRLGSQRFCWAATSQPFGRALQTIELAQKILRPWLPLWQIFGTAFEHRNHCELRRQIPIRDSPKKTRSDLRQGSSQPPNQKRLAILIRFLRLDSYCVTSKPEVERGKPCYCIIRLCFRLAHAFRVSRVPG